MPQIVTGEEFRKSLNLTPGQMGILIKDGLPHYRIPDATERGKGEDYQYMGAEAQILVDVGIAYIWLDVTGGDNGYQKGDWKALADRIQPPEERPTPHASNPPGTSTGRLPRLDD